jgi:hypothetical protein
MDDVLIFCGCLLRSPDKAAFGRRKTQLDAPSCEELNWGSGFDSLDFSQSILFTNTEEIVAREMDRIPFVEETIDFIDEEERVISFPEFGGRRDRGDARPMTAVSNFY